MDRLNCYCGSLVYLRYIRKHLYYNHDIKINDETNKKIFHIVLSVHDNNWHLPKLVSIKPLKIETYMQTDLNKYVS